MNEIAGFEALQAWLFIADGERAKDAAADFAATYRPAALKRRFVPLLDHYVEPLRLPAVPACPAVGG